MKTTLLGVVAALALTCLPAVHAEDRVDIKAPRVNSVFVDPATFSNYAHRYQLDNGQKVVFRQSVLQRYVKLDQGKELRLYATSPTTFVTEQGTRFEFRDDGDSLAISEFQKLPLAANVPASGLMMASRQ
jgi:hypothetical protein